MSAVVLSVETHYFALSDRDGTLTIRNVPDGRYQLNVWYERSSPEDLKRLDAGGNHLGYHTQSGRDTTGRDAQFHAHPTRISMAGLRSAADTDYDRP